MAFIVDRNAIRQRAQTSHIKRRSFGMNGLKENESTQSFVHRHLMESVHGTTDALYGEVVLAEKAPVGDGRVATVADITKAISQYADLLAVNENVDVTVTCSELCNESGNDAAMVQVVMDGFLDRETATTEAMRVTESLVRHGYEVVKTALHPSRETNFGATIDIVSFIFN